MARGAPDYGLYAVKIAPIVGLADLGEAVVRLGAISTWDRRGYVVYQDSFEEPNLLWKVEKTGTGWKPYLSSFTAWMGSQCAYLNAPYSASSKSTMSSWMPLLKEGRLGFEFWLQFEAWTPAYFHFQVYIDDGVNTAYLALKTDFIAGTLQIRTDAGWVIAVTDIMFTLDKHFFVPIKVVIDTTTDKYVRLMVANREFDLSTHSLLDMGVSTDHYINVIVEVVASGALADQFAYFDNFIMTQDEP